MTQPREHCLGEALLHSQGKLTLEPGMSCPGGGETAQGFRVHIPLAQGLNVHGRGLTADSN